MFNRTVIGTTSRGCPSSGQARGSATTLEKIDFPSLPKLAILAGPAGIGKTRFLLENFSRLVHQSQNPFLRDVIYLIPTAEHRERVVDLMLRKEKGFFGERVLTLNQLMRQMLKAGDFSMASDAERRFLLSEIVTNQGGEYFTPVANLNGFIETISAFIGELKESMVSLGSFKKGMERLKRLRPELAAKYDGLLKIYEAYEARLNTLGLKDHRDGLFLLQELPVLPRFRHIFVDGFFDFSKSQLQFLRWLAQRSEQVTMALTIDLNPERRGLFEIPLETLEELEKLGFQAIDLSCEKNHRASDAALSYVAGTVLKEPALAKEGGLSPIGPSPFLILEATGMRGEIEMIAREIRRMTQAEAKRGTPLHFSDIAVILRRIGEYEGVIRTVFDEFHIPFEIHERERLRDTPLARTFTSFFKVFLDNWKREDLFNFLKSIHSAKQYPEICSLEIQSFDLGITAGRERWLKEIRSPFFDSLCSYEDRFRASQTLEEWIRITEEAIQSFGLSHIPRLYEEQARRPQGGLLRRDFASVRRLRNLLEEIRIAHASWDCCAAPSGDCFAGKTFENFAHEFLRLIDVDLFSLHDRDKNRVQIYDISLARQKEYKMVFLAGLLEKQFPIEIREDPILSDAERGEVDLTLRLPRQAVERYFFYLGLTRARQRVILSYPRFDLEGHEALPSFYVDEVQRLFSSPIPKRSYSVSQSLPRLEDIVDEREIEAFLIQRFFDRNQESEKGERALSIALYNRLIQRNSFQTAVRRLLFDPVAKIQSKAVQAAFLPKGGIFKPTGLEIHGRCPYRYFANQVLRLEEGEDGIDPRVVGILLHDCLESYWRERVNNGRTELAGVDQAKAFMHERLHQLLKEKPLGGEKAYRIELKKRQMEQWLFRLIEKEIKNGGPLANLKPKYFEFEFGFKPRGGARSQRPEGGATPPLRLVDPYKEDLLLRGKIDRIDVDESGKFGLVIDYKTGGEFKKRDLDSGTALQLALYLLAIQQHLKLKPIGGEIYQISSAESKGFYLRESLEETDSRPNSRSVFGKLEFDQLLERAVRFSRLFADGITRADIQVRPRDCDPHCPFPSVCRIEKWRLPFIYCQIHEEDKKNGIV